jgi:uncharacterized protein (DUF433 family)
VIKGTRIPVDAIVRRIAEGMSVKEILVINGDKDIMPWINCSKIMK